MRLAIGWPASGVARVGWLLAGAAAVAGCSGVRPGLAPASGSPGAGRAAGLVRSQVALEDLRMISPLVGWAVAVHQGGSPRDLVRTTDGGRTWRAAGPRGLHGQPLRASFTGAADAWVTWSFPQRRAWPVMYRTTDGGRMWERMGLVPIAAIGASAPDMVTGRVGWITASLGVATGNSGIAIFRTGDGGASWHLVELTDGQAGGEPRGAIPFACDKSFAVFSSARVGWVAGSCAGGRPAFWVSRDGERAWRYQPLPIPSGRGLLASCQCGLTPPTFTSPTDGAIWVGGLPGSPRRDAAAYLTRDGGRSWTPIRLPGGNVPLQGPDFTDARHGFVLGGLLTREGTLRGRARMYATTDGGASWVARTASALPGQATIDFVTPAIGFATVTTGPDRSYLLRTSNGGMSWAGIPARLAGDP